MLFGLWSYELAQADFERQAFLRSATVRRDNMSLSLQAYQRDMELVGMLFASSEEVTPEDFQTFGQALMTAGVHGVCFIPDHGENLEVRQADVLDPCAHVHVDEPVRVAPDDRPVVEMSSPARSQTQNGHVALIFTLDSIFPGHDGNRPLRRYLELPPLSGRSRIYEQGMGVRLRDATTVDHDGLHTVLPLSGLHPHVSYVAVADPEGGSPLQWLLRVMVLAFGLMIALYVDRLLSTRAVIRREVARRTEELEHFAYRSSHDLRGPLVSIAGLCRATLEDLEEGHTDDLKDNLLRVQHQTTRLASMVEDILEIARADLVDLPSDDVEVRALARQVVDEVVEDLPSDVTSPVTIDVESGPPVRIHASRVRLAQILRNLISNGVRYRTRSVESWVRVSVRVERGAMEISVEDNGLGLDEAQQAVVFERFTRMHPTHTFGSGLGLAIVQRHVERMGGGISVESAVGSGSRFTVRLPAN